MSIIKCPEKIEYKKDDWKVFLMGPIQGAPEWQFAMPEISHVVWLSPRRENYKFTDSNYSYAQMDWETEGIDLADVLLVWIPEESEHVEGRSYAQTTRFEVGENLAKGKKMIIGINDNFPGRKYFEYKATKYDNVINHKIYHTLEECIEALKKHIVGAKKNCMI